MSAFTIRTYPTGRYFDLLDPRPEMVSLEDMAHALARNCRFTGHVRPESWPVAPHALWACEMVGFCQTVSGSPWLRVHALVHDCAEAYTGDISGPMKALLRALGVTAVTEIEARIQVAIYEALGIPVLTEPDKGFVKYADARMLTTEYLSVGPGWRDERPVSWCAPFSKEELQVGEKNLGPFGMERRASEWASLFERRFREEYAAARRDTGRPGAPK